MTSLLTALLGFVPGAFLGRRLATHGFTAQNALIGRQRLAYAILVGVAVAGALIYYSYKVWWLPDTLVLYGEVAFLPPIARQCPPEDSEQHVDCQHIHSLHSSSACAGEGCAVFVCWVDATRCAGSSHSCA